MEKSFVQDTIKPKVDRAEALKRKQEDKSLASEKERLLGERELEQDPIAEERVPSELQVEDVKESIGLKGQESSMESVKSFEAMQDLKDVLQGDFFSSFSEEFELALSQVDSRDDAKSLVEQFITRLNSLKDLTDSERVSLSDPDRAILKGSLDRARNLINEHETVTRYSVSEQGLEREKYVRKIESEFVGDVTQSAELLETEIKEMSLDDEDAMRSKIKDLERKLKECLRDKMSNESGNLGEEYQAIIDLHFNSQIADLYKSLQERTGQLGKQRSFDQENSNTEMSPESSNIKNSKLTPVSEWEDHENPYEDAKNKREKGKESLGDFQEGKTRRMDESSDDFMDLDTREKLDEEESVEVSDQKRSNPTKREKSSVEEGPEKEEGEGINEESEEDVDVEKVIKEEGYSPKFEGENNIQEGLETEEGELEKKDIKFRVSADAMHRLGSRLDMNGGRIRLTNETIEFKGNRVDITEENSEEGDSYLVATEFDDKGREVDKIFFDGNGVLEGFERSNPEKEEAGLEESFKEEHIGEKSGEDKDAIVLDSEDFIEEDGIQKIEKIEKEIEVLDFGIDELVEDVKKMKDNLLDKKKRLIEVKKEKGQIKRAKDKVGKIVSSESIRDNDIKEAERDYELARNHFKKEMNELATKVVEKQRLQNKIENLDPESEEFKKKLREVLFNGETFKEIDRDGEEISKSFVDKFNEFQKELSDLEAQSMGKKDRGVLRKGLEKYQGLSKKKKLILSMAIAGGVGIASGMGTAQILGYVGGRVAKRAVGAKVGAGVGAVTGAMTHGAFEKKRERRDFDFKKSILEQFKEEGEGDAESESVKFMESLEDFNEKQRKSVRNEMLVKVGATVGGAALATGALNIMDLQETMAGLQNNVAGSSVATNATPMSAPGNVNSASSLSVNQGGGSTGGTLPNSNGGSGASQISYKKATKFYNGKMAGADPRSSGFANGALNNTPKSNVNIVNFDLEKGSNVWNNLREHFGNNKETAITINEFRKEEVEELANKYTGLSKTKAKAYVEWRFKHMNPGEDFVLKDGKLEIEEFDSRLDEFLGKQQKPIYSTKINTPSSQQVASTPTPSQNIRPSSTQHSSHQFIPNKRRNPFAGNKGVSEPSNLSASGLNGYGHRVASVANMTDPQVEKSLNLAGNLKNGFDGESLKGMKIDPINYNLINKIEVSKAVATLRFSPESDPAVRKFLTVAHKLGIKPHSSEDLNHYLYRCAANDGKITTVEKNVISKVYSSRTASKVLSMEISAMGGNANAGI